MSEIEDIKKKKLEEMQSSMQQKVQDEIQSQQEARQQVDALEQMIKTRLTKEALQRYGNIKTADPEKAMHVLLMLAQMIQSGRMEKVDDMNLKRMLMMMNQKKDIKITRK